MFEQTQKMIGFILQAETCTSLPRIHLAVQGKIQRCILSIERYLKDVFLPFFFWRRPLDLKGEAKNPPLNLHRSFYLISLATNMIY